MTASAILLGVNIDHVATLRQARGGRAPDPLLAALVAEQWGADGITLHLREDRRHIQDRDVRALRAALQTRMNLEIAATAEMIAIALEVQPADACLVPEKRTEVTTEGGLDVAGQLPAIADACRRLAAGGIRVSLFIDPDAAQVDAAARAGAPVVELHTGAYAEAQGPERGRELARLAEAARRAAGAGLVVNAGHGLDYHNVQPVAAIPQLVELNIGHAIVARAVMGGLGPAVAEMKRLMVGARGALPRMIFGIGTDLVQVERIEATYRRFGEHFVERLLMPEERAVFDPARRPVRFLAMRFAAKEAISKALGTGFRHGVWIRDFGFKANAWGKPEVIFSARGRAVADRLGAGEGHVSLTDEAGLVMAMAVLMKKP